MARREEFKARDNQNSSGDLDAELERLAALSQVQYEHERKLDQLFASKSISTRRLHEELKMIAALQSQVREAHLDVRVAHPAELVAEAAQPR